MKTITSKILFQRLQNELVRSHQYSIVQSDTKFILLRSVLSSKFGKHVLLFNLQQGSCETIHFPYHNDRHFADDFLKTAIELFIQKIFDALVNQIVGGDINGL